MIFQFGGYHLNTLLLELRREDSPVHIEPQVFDLLRLLIENRDRIMANKLTPQCSRHGRAILRYFADDTVGNEYVVEYATAEPRAVAVDCALQIVVCHRSWL